jgi:glycosyltransferase involved in cell wall biosynthesis
LFRGKKIGVFHPGTQHSWQTALAFQEAGQLSWYATSVFYDPSRWPYRVERLLPSRAAQRLNAQFKRRYTPELDIAKVRQFGFWEWLESGSARLGSRGLAKWANRQGNMDFGRGMIGLIKREPVDVVWGYDSASLEVFRWAKSQGLLCVLDQTNVPLALQNRILLQERMVNPEFFNEGYMPEPQSGIDRESEELALADLVVVGSMFCARAIVESGCTAEKVRIVPYGFDESRFPMTLPKRCPLRGRPIEFLFAGSVVPRKGIAYLLKAFARVPAKAASLTLLGGLYIPRATFDQYADRVKHIPFVPQPQVVSHFASADCFVFPSLFEGGGIVLYEANGSGLGIIQTTACGDGVREGRNGMVLSEVSVASVQQAIETVLDDQTRLVEWQHASWEMRGERSWQSYRQRLRSLAIL